MDNDKQPGAKEKRLAKDLELKERYVYNSEDDKYVSYLTCVAKPIVIDGDMHRAMKRAYCGEDGRSVEEICLANSFPPYLFAEYKTIHGWSRKSCILTDEEVYDSPIEDSVDAIIGHKKFEIYQEIQKRSWNQTEIEAKKWRAFQLDIFDPFEEAIERWIPPKMKHIPKPRAASKGGEWFVIGFADWQIGSEAVGRFLFNQDNWNTDIAERAIDKLFEKILLDIKNFNFKFEGCVLMLAGDLFHGLRGHTEKGTQLDCDVLREDQCEVLMNILTRVISRLIEIFPKVEVHSVRGNHEGADHYPLMMAVKNYFRTCAYLNFNIHSTRTALFKIKDTLVLLDHGASDIYKADVPKSGKPRESYIQSLLLCHPEELVGVNQRLFFQGDKHHYEQIEYGDFEFIMLGALPLGDQYSDNLNLKSARQNCFVIDGDGLKTALHYYIR